MANDATFFPLPVIHQPNWTIAMRDVELLLRIMASKVQLVDDLRHVPTQYQMDFYLWLMGASEKAALSDNIAEFFSQIS
jgi:hypothetical protein